MSNDIQISMQKKMREWIRNYNSSPVGHEQSREIVIVKTNTYHVPDMFVYKLSTQNCTWLQAGAM